MDELETAKFTRHKTVVQMGVFRSCRLCVLRWPHHQTTQSCAWVRGLGTCVCVACVCMCVRERETERASVCVCGELVNVDQGPSGAVPGAPPAAAGAPAAAACPPPSAPSAPSSPSQPSCEHGRTKKKCRHRIASPSNKQKRVLRIMAYSYSRAPERTVDAFHVSVDAFHVSSSLMPHPALAPSVFPRARVWLHCDFARTPPL